DAPEEPIALDECGRGGVIEGAGAREALERRRRREPPRVGRVMPVDELERLGEELDVHEPAAAVLHVQAPARLAAELALHPRVHLRDLLERRARKRIAVDQLGERRANTPREGAVAQDEPRAGQGLPLPQVTMLQIVPLERTDARGEPTALAAGPKPQVDRKGDAGRCDVAEHRGQPLRGQTVEPVGVDPVGPVARSPSSPERKPRPAPGAWRASTSAPAAARGWPARRGARAERSGAR